ncbi:MAG: MBL fold metallo-hydrolase [Candidatus Aminicenantes bacterium]
MRKTTFIQRSLLFFIILFFCAVSPPLLSQQEEPAIAVEKVSGEVYCLYGQGGNIGILKTEDKLLVVDSQYARNAEDVLKEIRKLSPNQIVYLINTHYHGDHTGGNPIIGKDAKIISHENCLKSFLAGLKPEESAESKGAPQITYEDEMKLEIDDETVRLVHFGPGHTSGDTVVVFEQSHVIHAGDLFFHGIPPYIDVEDGSDTGNWVVTIGKLAEKYPDFKVIPGHGRAADMKAFMDFADYLRYLRGQVVAAIEAGKSREQATESIDLSRFSHIQDSGEFLTKKKNIGWIYDEMTRK